MKNIMKKTITVLTLLLNTVVNYAQDPNILWQRTIGGSGEDLCTDINSTIDGGYIIAGMSDSDISGEKSENSKGESDYWIVKLDINGNIDWQKTIGGEGEDHLRVILQTNDGGYILGGDSKSNISGDKTENSIGLEDYWIVKITSTGLIEWQNTIGGSGHDILYTLIATSDGGYLLGGSSNSNISGDKTEDAMSEDYWIVKIDNLGNVEWDNTIGGSSPDYLKTMVETIDNGFLIGGDSWSDISGDKTEATLGIQDYWILKLDSSGNIEWQNTIGGNEREYLESVISLTDGGFLVTGSSDSNISGDKTENSNGEYDIWIVKVDSSGNIIWQNTIGGSLNDGAKNITKTINGGFFLSGSSESNISGDKTENSEGYTDYWVIGLNDVGIINWQNTLGGDFIDVPSGGSLETENSVFLIAGESSSSASGDKTEDSRGGIDYWILKVNGILNVSENPFNTAITLYPNPVKNTLQINTQDKTINQVNIYTITGSKVLQRDIDTVSPTVDVSGLASGVYYIQLYSGKNVALKKFVKE